MEKHRKKLIKNATVFDGHSSGLAQGKKIVIEDDIVTEITADEVSEILTRYLTARAWWRCRE